MSGLGLSFSAALVHLIAGAKIQRTGWNGPGQYVAMQRPDENSKMSRPYAYLVSSADSIVPWVPSQGDLFSHDWVLVPN